MSNRARFIPRSTVSKIGAGLPSAWGTSENNRKAKFYKLTADGRKQLTHETRRWRQIARAIGLVMGEV